MRYIHENCNICSPSRFNTLTLPHPLLSADNSVLKRLVRKLILNDCIRLHSRNIILSTSTCYIHWFIIIIYSVFWNIILAWEFTENSLYRVNILRIKIIFYSNFSPLQIKTQFYISRRYAAFWGLLTWVVLQHFNVRCLGFLFVSDSFVVVESGLIGVSKLHAKLQV